MNYLGKYADAALHNVNLTTQSKVLDIACGPGPGTGTRRPHHQVAHIEALDFSEKIIEILTKSACSDSCSSPTDTKASIAHRVLKPNGQALE